MSELQIQTRGQGPDLVMVHGWCLHSGVWEGLADTLSERYRVHVLDLPGHGVNRDAGVDLYPPAVSRALMDLPPAIWLGWSLGGLFSLHHALHHPQQVSGLALMASNPCFVHRPHWPHGVERTVFEAFADELRDDLGRALDRFLALEVHGARDARPLLRRLKAAMAMFPAPRGRALKQGLETLLEADFSMQLEQIRCPTNTIAGRRDRLVPVAALRETARRLPDARCIEIAGAGHAPFMGHRMEVVAAIDDLARRIPAGDRS